MFHPENKSNVVDGETYGCVKSFCYLGDTLDGECGVHLAATLESEMAGRSSGSLCHF